MTLTPEIRWIDTLEALDAACAEVAGAEVIALDTEFFREKTFHPIPALIQFSAGGPAWRPRAPTSPRGDGPSPRTAPPLPA